MFLAGTVRPVGLRTYPMADVGQRVLTNVFACVPLLLLRRNGATAVGAVID